MAANAALAVLWTSSVLGVLISVGRLAARKWRSQKFTKGDYFTIVALVCMLCRLVLVHLVTVWGTTNTLDKVIAAGTLPAYRESQVATASKLLVASRITYTVFLWSLKLVVLDLCSKLLEMLDWRAPVIHCYYTIFCVTFIGVVVSGLVECRPIHLYWQLRPAAGSCVSGNLWLVVYGACNILTDLILMAIPFPLLLKVRTTRRKKMNLFILFSLGAFLIAATIMRIVLTFSDSHDQLNRNIWTSIETIVANIVAHAPVFYTLRHESRLNENPHASGNRAASRSRSRSRRRPSIARAPSVPIGLSRVASDPLEIYRSPEELKDWAYDGGRQVRVHSAGTVKTHHSLDLEMFGGEDSITGILVSNTFEINREDARLGEEDFTKSGKP